MGQDNPDYARSDSDQLAYDNDIPPEYQWVTPRSAASHFVCGNLQQS